MSVEARLELKKSIEVLPEVIWWTVLTEENAEEVVGRITNLFAGKTVSLVGTYVLETHDYWVPEAVYDCPEDMQTIFQFTDDQRFPRFAEVNLTGGQRPDFLRIMDGQQLAFVTSGDRQVLIIRGEIFRRYDERAGDTLPDTIYQYYIAS